MLAPLCAPTAGINFRCAGNHARVCRNNRKPPERGWIGASADPRGLLVFHPSGHQEPFMLFCKGLAPTRWI